MYNKSNIIMHDKIQKKLFTSNHNDLGKRLCARIIATLIGENEEDIYNNIEFIHPNISGNNNYPNNEAKESTSLLERYLYFLVNDNKDLDVFYKVDELMEKTLKEVDYLSREKDAILFYDSDELYRLARLDAIKEGKDQGLEEGRQEGIKQGIKEKKHRNCKKYA